MSIRDQMNPKREIFLNKYTNIADAFNRLRVSSPTILFDSQLQYNKRPEHWLDNESTSRTVTHLSSEASVQLGVNTAGLTTIRQTREYFRYQPGTSQLILLTFGGMNGQSGADKYVGYGDNLNGIFFKSDADGYYFVRRTNTSGSVIDTEVEQASWSFDKMNGNGPSRYNLDFSKVQILVVDMEWLGVGRVRCGFVVDGQIVYAHEFLQANVGTEVYMQSPNLPVRYAVAGTTGLSSTVTLKQICASVMSEGGREVPSGQLRTIGTESSLQSVTSATGAHVDVISIRPRLTYKGKTNRLHMVIQGFEVFSEDQDIHYDVIYGGTSNSSSAGWLPVSTAFSGMDYTVSGTITTGGVKIAEGYVQANTIGANAEAGGASQAFQHEIELSLNIAGNGHPTVAADGLSNQITITAITLGADSDVGASISWVEEG